MPKLSPTADAAQLLQSLPNISSGARIWSEMGKPRGGRHLILVAQVRTKQEKQKEDDDISRSKAGITDRDQEEMVIVGEMRNCTEW